MALIELSGIRKHYPAGEQDVEVLHGIDLSIEAGEFMAIMGSSGSGKSTLMHLIGCLDQPSGGEYRFAGRLVTEMDHEQLAWLRREMFGFVFQSYHLVGTASAWENVALPAIYAACPARSASSVPSGCSASWAWASAWSTCPTSSPAVSSSGFPSPGR
ncbi:macrolide export ATP-binding/permease protein MacB [Halomonas elongata]|uniref:Macrolide export ATP-binding/permease protein MacB n=1 Tax=Halomonas elongata TaxID=2746 RepID=A0A1B8NZV4_HALEL|nr:ABC transporter ATP-binding protein [Halomonas elongata]OBX35557.1 macrolide export ATP-binding/permease protein MacB [Halomonas elongata]